MKTHVTFTRDSPTLEHEGHQPFGKEIASALIRSLSEQGLGNCKLDSLDFAFACFAPAHSRRCYVMIGLIDDNMDHARHWLITCDPSRGLFDWLLRKDYSVETTQVANAIHEFLADDPDVIDIRWYTAADWKNDSENWSTVP